MRKPTSRTLTRLIQLGSRIGQHRSPATRRFATIVPTAIAALLAVAAASGSTPDGAMWNDAKATDPPAPSLEMALENLLVDRCYLCGDCGKFGHKILNRRPWFGGGKVAAHPHPCLEDSGRCDLPYKEGGHRSCGIFAAGSSDVIRDLKASTPDELAGLLEGSPHRLRINRSRKALQLIGCPDQVVASYSVNSIPALEALLS